MLQADSAAQKTAMRERIDAVSMSDFEMQSTFSILGFNAVLSPYTYDLPISIPDDMRTEAAGRPYELQISGSVDGRNASENTTIKVEIRSAANGGGILYGETLATSVLGAAQSYTVSAMIPPTITQFYVRYSRTAGTAPDGYDGQGYGKIKVGQLAKDVYIDSTAFDGNLGPGDDTVQELAQKVDDLVIPLGVPADQSIAQVQHNGNSSNPAPDVTYTINGDLVTANARDLYNLKATFNFDLNNQQLLEPSVFTYEIATASTGGTVLATSGTRTITASSAIQFSLTVACLLYTSPSPRD